MRKENGICQHPATIIVDVANVMGSRPDGWWRDRAAAAARLHAEITALAAEGTALAAAGPARRDRPAAVRHGAGGSRPRGGRANRRRQIDTAKSTPDRIGAADRVRVVQADGSGDDAIVALVRELPGRRFVVTADRELRRRCEAAGATVLGPGWLLGLLRRGDRP